MPSNSTPTKLGPFIGGLNLASDPSAIEEIELVECTNFELDLDGSLRQRPPFVALADVKINALAIGNAVLDGVSYIMFSDTDGVTLYNVEDSSRVTMHATVTSRVALQYRNLIYVVATADSASNGGYYNLDTLTWTTDANMPRGEAAVFYKSRMFIVPGATTTTNPSRLRFTDPVIADTLDWEPTNIIDISPGDGQNLVDICVSNDNLLLFKQDSTYVYAFDLQPDQGVVRLVNPVIGSSAYRGVTQYENSTFCLHEGKVYEIVNYDFAPINTKVPFELDATVPASTTYYYYPDNIDTYTSLVGANPGAMSDDSDATYATTSYVETPFSNAILKMDWTTPSTVDVSARPRFRLSSELGGAGTEAQKTFLINFNDIATDGVNYSVGWLIVLREPASTPVFDLTTWPTAVSTDYATGPFERIYFTNYTGLDPQDEPWTEMMARLDAGDLYVSIIHQGAAGAVSATHTVYEASIVEPTASLTWKVPTFLCLLGDRLVCRYFNRIYVYGLDTKSWSLWNADAASVALNYWGPLVPAGNNFTQRANIKYYAGSAISADWAMVTIVDGYSSSVFERGYTPIGGFVNYNIESTILTKNYDFDTSHSFKKLMWWGADAISKQTITATVTPVVLGGVSNTWGDNLTRTWAVALTTTWDDSAVTFVETVRPTGRNILRLFAKFLQTLRFRQINFRVTMLGNGTTTQGPPRIFTLTAIIGNKQIVPEAIN